MTSSNFYVYRYTDPRNQQVFYIGKGCKDRAFDITGHAHNRIVINKVNKILREGNTLDKVVDVYITNLTEREAFEAEKNEIKRYGTKFDNTGCLLNLTKGGDNPPNQLGRHWQLSAESKEKMRNSWTPERRLAWGKYQQTKPRTWNRKISQSKLAQTPVDKLAIETQIRNNLPLKDIIRANDISMDIIRARFIAWYGTPRYREVRLILQQL